MTTGPKVMAHSLTLRNVSSSTELEKTRTAARNCHDCSLWKDATQTVFGEGHVPAKLMLVGEQPGDREDLEGQPFVGPAGNVLNRALVEAGIARAEAYVTNAVKHFKFEMRGKRRLHKKPNFVEIRACNQWLRRELEVIKPQILIALGATAAQALLGKATPIEVNRGKIMSFEGGKLLITVHPSALLRILMKKIDLRLLAVLWRISKSRCKAVFDPSLNKLPLRCRLSGHSFR